MGLTDRRFSNTGREPDSGFNGWMEQVVLPELIQFICLEGKNRLLTLRHKGLQGEIYFSQGQVVHAESPGNSGVDAFFEMMAWKSGIFSLTESRPAGNSIDMPWNFLVMEALRRIDEGQGQDYAEGGHQNPVRILIVDDSPLFCKALRKCLEGIKDTIVAGQASNGKEALELIRHEEPDLVTLDINMPVMAGDLTLKHIMIRSPAPVLLISGFSEDTFPVVMDFMRLGAVDFVPKPKDEDAWEKACSRIRRAVELARDFEVKNIRRARAIRPASQKAAPGPPADHLILIAGGAGGLLEIQKILPRIYQRPGHSVLVVQDMVPSMTGPLSRYMNTVCQGIVAPVEEKGLLAQGRCWIAHGAMGLRIAGSPDERLIQKVDKGGGQPAFDRLLSTASEFFGSGLTVLLISGAETTLDGLKRVKEGQGRIYVQNPETCLHGNPLEMLLDTGLLDGTFEPETVDGILPEVGSFEAELGAELLEGLTFEGL